MEKISIEELVIDDSFINYCLNKNTDDVEYWQVFAALHPADATTIREAREIVLGLSLVMQKQAVVKQNSSNLSEKQTNKFSFKKALGYAAVAAGLIFSIIIIQRSSSNKTGQVFSQQQFNAGKAQTYTTANARHKKMKLPDGTQITLNAGSLLSIAGNFGQKSRDVYLDGEAVFDVAHNAKLPFIVHTAFYNVKVLGTLFNVKAYHTERKSETSLLRGSVEIILKNNKKVTLTPNNKVVFSIDEKSIIRRGDKPDSIISINPISYNTKDSVVNETAWMQNRLEINNETFEQIKAKLERWYDVQITFADQESAAYTFTASFDKETIEQVLEALQYSYHFNYKKDGKNITISK